MSEKTKTPKSLKKLKKIVGGEVPPTTQSPQKNTTNIEAEVFLSKHTSTENNDNKKNNTNNRYELVPSSTSIVNCNTSCIGSSPKKAAIKIFNKLAKEIKLSNNKFIVYTIKNTSTNKQYKYIGTRRLLSEPKKVMFNGKEVTYMYDVIVGKYADELNHIEKNVKRTVIENPNKQT